MQNLAKEKIVQFLNFDKLSNIRLLELPKVEKKDVPDYIDCPKYKKAKSKLDAKMERYNSKISRLAADIKDMKQTVAAYREQCDVCDRKMYKLRNMFNEVESYNVNEYNSWVSKKNHLIDKIGILSEKHDDTIDKLTEAEEEAKEALEELTHEALSVIDEDIVMVINRCEGVADNLAHGETAEELIAAVEVCLTVLRVYAMFEDLIDDNNARMSCRDGIAKVNQILSTLCANANVQNHVVEIYRRNLDLVKTNADIHQQIVSALGAVDQNQLDNLANAVNAPLNESIDTKFDYSSVIDPAQIDAIVTKINQTIDLLVQNIERADAAQTSATEYAVTGVNADKRAKTLRETMQSNVDSLNGGLTQSHFAVQLVEEPVIDDFLQKDLRAAATAFRKHIIGTLGEDNFESVLSGGDDLFTLKKAQEAIEKANLTRLQTAADKIPKHINKFKEKITELKSDIQKANAVPQRNADVLQANLNGRYVRACVPLFGWISAIGINGRVNAFESAFRSNNPIFYELGSRLKRKNRTVIIILLAAILCFAGIATLRVLNLPPDSIFVDSRGYTVYTDFPFGFLFFCGIVTLLYFIETLILASVGKKLRNFCKGGRN